MKKISCIGLLITLSAYSGAFADNANDLFKDEVLEGLDLISAKKNIDKPVIAPGELGADVYQSAGIINPSDIQMFIPTSMYLRAGAGLNLGFATGKASISDDEYESSGSWTSQIGLGWNLSSYVRGEIDFQHSAFKFSDLDNMQADYNTVGGMLYFDFARRYVQNGDITRRRTFVPFMGLGAGFGQYEFQGKNGSNGFVIAAPRAAIGFNVMFNDLIGVDIMYQYQMMIGNGFGWNGNSDSVNNISNIMASFRANF